MRGAIVPHAPVLLPEVSTLPAEETEDLCAAVASLEFETPSVVVISPHGSTSGVHRTVGGSLNGFGMPHVDVERATDARLCESLAGSWGRPMLDGGLDHGVVVPLLCGLATGASIVGVCLREVTGPGSASLDDVMQDASQLGEALRDLGDGVGVVASVNTAAALTPRAPLTERPGARDVERRLLEALGRELAGVEDIAYELWLEGGSCAPGPLVALARAVPDARTAPLVYDHPYGVGYLVAELS